MEHERKIKCELYNDNFQNWKKYPIQKAQLVIADVPYALGKNAYGSSPVWYNGGDNKNGESKFAGKQFFPSDQYFNLYEYFHFYNQLLKKEPKKAEKEEKVLMLHAWYCFAVLNRFQHLLTRQRNTVLCITYRLYSLRTIQHRF